MPYIRRRGPPPIRPNADGTGFVRCSRNDTTTTSVPDGAAKSRTSAAVAAVAVASSSSSNTLRSRLSGSGDVKSGDAAHDAQRTHRRRDDDRAARRAPVRDSDTATLPSRASRTGACGVASSGALPVHADSMTQPQSYKDSRRDAAASTQRQRRGSGATTSSALPSSSSAPVAAASSTSSLSSSPSVTLSLHSLSTLSSCECQLSYATARELCVCSGSIVRVHSCHGSCHLEVVTTSSVAPSCLYTGDDTAALLLDKHVTVTALPLHHPLPRLARVVVNVAVDGYDDDAIASSSNSSNNNNTTNDDKCAQTPSATTTTASREARVTLRTTADAELQWRALFRAAFQHRVVYTGMRTTLRWLTHRVSLHVVALEQQQQVRCASRAAARDADVTTAVAADATPCARSDVPAGTASVDYGLLVEGSVVCTTLTCGASPAGVVADAAHNNTTGGDTRRDDDDDDVVAATVLADVSSWCASSTTATTASARAQQQTLPPHVLVVGAAGTGKTYQLQRLAQRARECGVRVCSLAVDTLLGDGDDGDDVGVLTRLRERLAALRRVAPVLLLVDDLHLLCGATTSFSWTTTLLARRLCAELHDMRRHGVCVRVVASAPSTSALDAALRADMQLSEDDDEYDDADGDGVVRAWRMWKRVQLQPPRDAAARLRCLRHCLRDEAGVVVAAAAAAVAAADAWSAHADGTTHDATYEHARQATHSSSCDDGDASVTSPPPPLDASEVRRVADEAHGYTQRDLLRVVHAAMAHSFAARGRVTALRRGDLLRAAAAVAPSALQPLHRDVVVTPTRWDDIGGSAEAKAALQSVVAWSRGAQRWLFDAFDLTPPRGVLLYGPPGCSKTMLARALAHESKMSFVAVKGPEVFSKWVGDSEKAVRDLFARARAAAPCVVFIDELDGMCGHRGHSNGGGGGGNVADRVIAQFLTELDGLPAALASHRSGCDSSGSSGARAPHSRARPLVFVAATNRPDHIDPAVLRPGRVDRRVYVGLPDHDERAAIARIQFRRVPTTRELTPEYVAARTDGYTGAEVVAVIKEAAYTALDADVHAAAVSCGDVDVALRKVRPRVSAADVAWYKRWAQGGNVTRDVHAHT